MDKIETVAELIELHTAGCGGSWQGKRSFRGVSLDLLRARADEAEESKLAVEQVSGSVNFCSLPADARSRQLEAAPIRSFPPAKRCQLQANEI